MHRHLTRRCGWPRKSLRGIVLVDIAAIEVLELVGRDDVRVLVEDFLSNGCVSFLSRNWMRATAISQ